MFTGIIEEIGQVSKISKRGNLTLIEIKAEKVPEGTQVGDSIAVNGACLTAVKKENTGLSFEVMPETLKITNLGALKTGERVNLERSLKMGERIGGHFVTGHIDCIGIIRKKHYLNSNLGFEISVPAEFLSYCLPKGSIAVDGISLTLVHKKANSFVVYVIPHTLQNTTLGFKGPSGRVNLEFDILAKGARIGTHSALH